MYENPVSLEDLCLETISSKIEEFIVPVYRPPYEYCFMIDESLKIVSEKTVEKFQFYEEDLFLINQLSEKLLAKLSEKNRLNDSVFHIFSEQKTKLENVKLKNCNVSKYGVIALKDHNITSLECVNLRRVTVGDILCSLNGWTRDRLTSAVFSKCRLVNTLTRHNTVVKLSSFKNLRNLDLSYTDLNQTGLIIITEDLKHIERLNLSWTYVNNFSPLLEYTDQLISLSVAGLQKADKYSATLVQMRALQYLDVSIVLQITEFRELLSCPVNEILENRSCLPKLTSLDLSGWKMMVSKSGLIGFLETHPKLEYLGLVLNNMCFEEEFNSAVELIYPDGLTIAGFGNEEQIAMAISVYRDKAEYMQKALYHLFQLSNSFEETRAEMFKAVLPVMELHPNKFAVQMAATACLYNLTKGDLSKQIHPAMLRTGVNLTLAAMLNFPEDFQLQKNSLLTLCSDRILQEVNFDKYCCAKLVLDALCRFDDPNMNRMAVAICSILAAKISTLETSNLGSKPKYMTKLLSLVRGRVETKSSDITLKFTLSALWNLTDESAHTCGVFLEFGGAQLFLDVLRAFPEDCSIQTKVLGLLNNIAEVSPLRPELMLDQLVSQLHVLLCSDSIDVSYFAAGIVAHLASDGDAAWKVECRGRDEMLRMLAEVVLQWEVPDSEMVAYRSFQPFFSLLGVDMEYEVQLWAIWAVHHVCTKNAKRYCDMLRAERGGEMLSELMEFEGTHPRIKQMAAQVLETLQTRCQCGRVRIT